MPSASGDAASARFRGRGLEPKNQGTTNRRLAIQLPSATPTRSSNMHTMITTSEELLAKLVSASVCGKCKGTRVTRRGKDCTACRGKGIADLTHPRIRFNGGFHDATLETSLGIKREVLATDAGGWFYAAGYAAGLTAVKDGAPRPSSSDPAWLVFVAPIVTLPEYTRAMGEWA